MYNILPDGTTLHVVSSLASAVVASTLALPVDVLFSRYVSKPNASLVDCLNELRAERAFFRGWVALVTRLAPTFSLAMPIYEHIRFFLGLGFL
jgi:hypothetical protein